MNRLIGAGTLVSAGVMALGLLLTAMYGIDAGMVLSPIQVFRDLVSLDPEAVLSLGILMLIMMPLMRILSYGALFIRDREWEFVLAVGAVLTVLCLAIVLGAY